MSCSTRVVISLLGRSKRNQTRIIDNSLHKKTTSDNMSFCRYIIESNKNKKQLRIQNELSGLQ